MIIDALAFNPWGFHQSVMIMKASDLQTNCNLKSIGGILPCTVTPKKFNRVHRPIYFGNMTPDDKAPLWCEYAC